MIFVTAAPYLGRSVVFEGRANGPGNFPARNNSNSYANWKISASFSSFLQIWDERPKSGMKCDYPDTASQFGDEQTKANIHSATEFGIQFSEAAFECANDSFDS
jgi:hypothetical protein